MLTTDTAPVLVAVPDPELRTAIEQTLTAAGHVVRLRDTAAGAEEAARLAPRCACAVVATSPSGESGHDLQHALRATQRDLPVIVVGEPTDARGAVRAFRDGAVDVVLAPVVASDLLAAVERAVRRGVRRRTARAWRAELRRRHALLTERERQVMALVVRGRLNKQIAAALGVAIRTVKAHRGRMMTKMEAASLADLVRMADLVLRRPAEARGDAPATAAPPDATAAPRALVEREAVVPPLVERGPVAAGEAARTRRGWVATPAARHTAYADGRASARAG